MKVSVLLTSLVTIQSCAAFSPAAGAASKTAPCWTDDGDRPNDDVMTRRQLMNGIRQWTAGGMLLTTGLPSVANAEATQLDFSLPSYNPNMSGFGEGSEASSTKIEGRNTGNAADNSYTDPGADEKEKQLRSMQLAEQARKEALAAKRQKLAAIEQEEKRRAAEKKAKNAERFASIFN